MHFYFEITTPFWLTLAGLIGLSFGSFLNVVIYRLPLMLNKTHHASRINLCFPRSHCPHCAHNIAVSDNIPIVGYLRLRGRCRNCQTPIGGRYPLVELLSALLCSVSAWLIGPTWECLLAWLLTWACITVTFIAWDKRAARREMSKA